jgi:hypothetical protein
MSITLAQLRLESRDRADMKNSKFVSDTELNNYINNSISELHDILIQAYDADYYVSEVTFQSVANQTQYALSTIVPSGDFYKLRGVDAKLNNSQWFTLQPFSFNERNRNQNVGTWSYLTANHIRYRLVGSNLVFTPVPEGNINIKLWYIPLAPTLAADGDILNDLNNFSEYIIVDAAIKMLQKEESDVSVLSAQKAALKRRIEEAANNRDAGQGEAISDIYSENDFYMFSKS